MSSGAAEFFELAAELAVAPAAITVGTTKTLARNAEDVAHDAQRLAPVLTGELKASISSASNGLTSEVTATARYAAYVEYGTSDTAPQPFMRPAAEAHDPLLERALDALVDGIL